MKKFISIILALTIIFTLSVPSFAKILKNGDTDGDGSITAADARLALRASVGLEVLNAEQTKISDLDGDGRITAADAREILRISVNLTPAGKKAEYYLPTDSTLDFYAEPSADSEITGTEDCIMTAFADVIKVVETKNNFGRTLYMGYEGWIKLSELTKLDTPAEPGRYFLPAGEDLRRTPGYGNTVHDTTTEDNYFIITVFQYVGDTLWCYVESGIAAGWVPYSKFKKLDEYKNDIQYVVKQNGAGLYAQTDYASSSLDYIKAGTITEIETAVYKNNIFWAKVNYGTKTGWVNMTNLRTEKLENYRCCTYTLRAISGCFAYASPSYESGVTGALPSGNTVNITAWYNDFGLTDKGLWVHKNAVRILSHLPGTENAIISDKDGCILYAEPAYSSYENARLPFGAIVKITDVYGNWTEQDIYRCWAKINYGSTCGWIPEEKLSEYAGIMIPGDYVVYPSIGIYVRSGPGLEYSIAGDYDMNDMLSINTVYYNASEKRFWGLDTNNKWAPLDYTYNILPEKYSIMRYVHSPGFIYEGRGYNYRELSFIPEGIFLYGSTGGDGEWAEVMYGNTTGFFDCYNFYDAYTFSYEPRLYTVNSSVGLNMRTGPGTEYLKTAHIDNGSVVYINAFTQDDTSWWGRTDNGSWVSMDYVK